MANSVLPFTTASVDTVFGAVAINNDNKITLPNIIKAPFITFEMHF
jgi:hypothetical protein